jgi:hypothetical protein
VQNILDVLMKYEILEFCRFGFNQRKFLRTKTLESNKCFIHSPAGDQLEIIFFRFYWQQDFKLMFIEAGLLIKQRCTKPFGGRTGTIFLYGYSNQVTCVRRFGGHRF